ncbi:cysteine desulfurase family protein [Alteraurantiacibacter palmitatis]|uniref:Cysteine desulfurase n=1 Tax=Alteraurantiacibacter palmitatis TaxID=2054628 RepID=A0ABV7E3H9_9SPHN
MSSAISARIYLDHAATSPLRPAAHAAMEEGFAIWANPSSPHAEGRRAKAALEDARARVKAALGWQGEVIFTSGASEALAIALGRAKAGARLVGAAEHDAVLAAAPDAEQLAVLPDGRIDPLVLAEAVQRERPLVAIQTVNSETGARQDEAALAALIHDAGGLWLADASQSAGKAPLPAGADMVVVSAHKLGGPVGIGALLVRDYGLLEPSGGHERGYRRGTENLPAAMGLAAALEAGEWCTTPAERLAFAAALEPSLLPIADRADHILALTHPQLSAQVLVIRLDAMGFAVSAGSACSSGSLKPSRVLSAMGLPAGAAQRTIRVSLGWNTTPDDLAAFLGAWASLA